MEWNQLVEEQERLQHLLLRRDHLFQQQNYIEAQLAALQQTLQEQRQARQKLEKVVAPSFIKRLMTSDAKLLRSEEQLATLLVKEHETEQQHEKLTNQLAHIVAEREATKNTDVLLEDSTALVAKQRIWLMQHDPNKAKKFDALEDEAYQVIALKIEVGEAIDASYRAEEALHAVEKALDAAHGLSTWDLFGGGMFVTYLKHSKLDASKQALSEAQYALNLLHNELIDIKEMQTDAIQVSIDGFVHFADYVFDDFFSALSVHSKITNAKAQLQQVLGEVNGIQDKLIGMQEVLLTRQAKIKEARIALLR